MRQQIKDVLLRIQKQQEFKSSVEHSPSNPTTARLNQDVHRPLSQEQKQGLAQRYTYKNTLRICLEANHDIKLVRTGSVSSLEIYWDESEDYIVVELSRYGPLAAVYTYGVPPAEVLQHLDTCLKAINLLKLSDAEINELNNQDLYYQLF